MLTKWSSLPILEMWALWVEMSVFVVFILVLIGDLLLKDEEKRGLGALTALGLGVIWLTTFFKPAQGLAFYGAYTSDGISMILKQVLLFGGMIASLASIEPLDRQMKDRQGSHYLMVLASLMGMLLLTGVRDLLLMVVALELMCIPAVILMALGAQKKSTQTAFKAFVIHGTASIFVLYGVSFMWGLSGGTDFYVLTVTPPSPLFSFGVLMCLAGLSVKMGVVPFNAWLSDIARDAPMPAQIFLSAAPQIAVIAVLCRVLDSALYAEPMQVVWFPILILLAILTMLVGSLTAVAQTDSRRLLSLTGLGHVGLLVLALAIGGRDGKTALVVYSLVYLVAQMGVLIVLACIHGTYGRASLSEFRGLFQRAPGLSLGMLVCLISLAGLPIMAGFWGKFFVIRTTWLAGYSSLAGLALLVSGVILCAYLKLVRSMFATDGVDDFEPIHSGRPTLTALLLCCLVTLGLGLAPNWFYMRAEAAIDSHDGLPLLQKTADPLRSEALPSNPPIDQDPGPSDAPPPAPDSGP